MTATGPLTLGNYLGALRFWVEDQHRTDSLFMVADLHALTVPHDPQALRDRTLELIRCFVAAGADPEQCALFVQSHVPEHSQMAWLLSCTASFGELKRMTQFKDKASNQEAASVGLFTYPVLMASDILLYDPVSVPVGDDQRQHLELCRDIAMRFNRRYGDVFVVPEASIPKVGARIRDLQDPTKKMSKSSESPGGTILLLEEPASIERKIKRAVTDTESDVRYDPESRPGASNLLAILAAATNRTPEDVANGYSQYGPLKSDTAAAVIELLAPIQQRYKELEQDPTETMRILAVGSAKARAIAGVTLDRAEQAMGLLTRHPLP